MVSAGSATGAESVIAGADLIIVLAGIGDGTINILLYMILLQPAISAGWR